MPNCGFAEPAIFFLMLLVFQALYFCPASFILCLSSFLSMFSNLFSLSKQWIGHPSQQTCHKILSKLSFRISRSFLSARDPRRYLKDNQGSNIPSSDNLGATRELYNKIKEKTSSWTEAVVSAKLISLGKIFFLI